MKYDSPLFEYGALIDLWLFILSSDVFCANCANVLAGPAIVRDTQRMRTKTDIKRTEIIL